MSEQIEFAAVLAQGAQAIKPHYDGFTRLWLDAWMSDVDEAKLRHLWRKDVRLKVTVEVDDA